ncbi:DUF452 family protein [Pelistega sp. NLN82]|uniref:DUF452 family protein n=1 Tax=Pelistega ratti TaxID=2652177 RepID=A0A6L9Y7E7_9BURK|nr:pimeloyl-ACP methyl esterase BioG family protein [Pelistega ratti]NEN75714.1 DUF452 family protein [Pelistega ratti]
MKTQFIQRHTIPSSHLIVYFSGWATPPELVSHLSIPLDYDVLLCSDYRDLTLNIDFSVYQSIHVVAWSMGVWVAEQVISSFPLASATAVNGTSFPCHDTLGIPHAVFEGTLTQLTPISRRKFERRMCESLFQYYNQFPAIPFEQTKQELQHLYDLLQIPKDKSVSNFPWTRAVIGLQDRIFPVDHLRTYWSQKAVPIVEINAPHYLFPYFTQWKELW